MRQDSNPTQTWNRIRDKANRGINDLILLAQKLPNDKQEELFNINNIKNIQQIISKVKFYKLTKIQKNCKTYV